MSESLIVIVVLSYFSLLFVVSSLTKGNSDNKTFFSGNKESPWYIVAFGMVGASLSGITFISVPGDVGSTSLTYFQVVLGYLFGYFVVAFVLLPIYYKQNLTSIYEYLGDRFGRKSHMTGAFFFFVSRVLGAAFRLFLVAIVLQEFVFNSWGIPFEFTVTISILLIWIYTFRGGIKTVVWTDTLQTFLMILSVFLSIYYITTSLDIGFIEFLNSDDFNTKNEFFLEFFSSFKIIHFNFHLPFQLLMSLLSRGARTTAHQSDTESSDLNFCIAADRAAKKEHQASMQGQHGPT